MKKLLLSVFLICLLPLFVPVSGFAAEQGVSAGYGFAFLNPHKRVGRLENSEQYDFFRFAYIYERPICVNNVAIVTEPWAAYINRPRDGADVGLDLLLKYYPLRHNEWRLFVTAGVGAAYTTIDFKEQGEHFMFILQGSVGLRYKNYFIENRFRHYSNGGTSSPNRSVHADIVSLGYYF
jgi:hypothetical protein